MRTTLDIDDDVLSATKELARSAHKTAGKIISELARKALTQPSEAARSTHEPAAFYGIRPLPRRGGIVSNELVNRIREEEGI